MVNNEYLGPGMSEVNHKFLVTWCSRLKLTMR